MTRTCLITGTTHGIGLETARALAAAGLHVIMACRNAQRAELVRDHLRRTTGNTAIETVALDLASLASVRDCASRVLETGDRLDLLVNNAGLMCSTPKRSADGFEMTFACNHLGPFLLTELLLPRLQQTAAEHDAARIVNVASAVHARATLDPERPDGDGRYRAMQAYARSKLANVAYTLALARRLDGTGVTANCLHPGVVASNILPEDNALLRFAGRVAARFMLTPERGAATSVYLALSPQVAAVSGGYFDQHQRLIAPAPAARDEALQQRLVANSRLWTGLST
ncbi:MAG: SDR family oxidoreductase [Pseudomonadales bacterium]